MRLLVHETVIVEELHIIVEFKHDGQSIWNLVPFDLRVAQALQNFENAAKCILVANDDHALIIHNLRTDDVVPEWHNAFDRAFQRFDGWEHLDRHILVADVIGRVPEVVHLNAGPGIIVTVAPVLQIFLRNVSIGRVLLQALKSAIMLLVQTPVLLVRYPMQVKLLGNRMVRPYRALEHRGVR